MWRYSFDRRSQSHQSHFVKVTSKLKQSKTASASQRGALTARLQIVGPADDSDASAPFVLLATVSPIVAARWLSLLSQRPARRTRLGSRSISIQTLATRWLSLFLERLVRRTRLGSRPIVQQHFPLDGILGASRS